ncbi:MAG: hypothetical protein ACREKN_03830 [Longimicrobiaceae bacterium]
MAEIKVERKRTSPWLWIVLVIVVAILAWVIYDQYVAEDPVIDEETIPADFGLLLEPSSRR